MGYYKNNTPFDDEIEVLTSTRQDGFSSGPYESFNLSYNVGDDPNLVLQNREKLCKDLNIDPASLIIPEQKNTDIVLKINDIQDNRICDALYTSNKNLVLSIIHSDCAPIFLYAKDKQIIAAIHSAINGSFLQIVKKTVKTLISKEGVDPKSIYVIYGPGVLFSHIIVDEKIRDKAEKLGYLNCIKQTFDNLYLDVNLLNYMQLREMGVPSKNIILNKYDTYENANLFFSSMRNNTTGRMISLIKFKK